MRQILVNPPPLALAPLAGRMQGHVLSVRTAHARTIDGLRKWSGYREVRGSEGRQSRPSAKASGHEDWRPSNSWCEAHDDNLRHNDVGRHERSRRCPRTVRKHLAELWQHRRICKVKEEGTAEKNQQSPVSKESLPHRALAATSSPSTWIAPPRARS